MSETEVTAATAFCPGPFCQRRQPYIEEGDTRRCAVCKRLLVVPGPTHEETLTEVVEKVRGLEAGWQGLMLTLAEIVGRVEKVEKRQHYVDLAEKTRIRAVDAEIVALGPRIEALENRITELTGLEAQVHGLAAVVNSFKQEIEVRKAPPEAPKVAPPRGKTPPKKKGKR